MFNSSSAQVAGKEGGKVKSKAKRKTARANGKLGGRPSSRTFAERLLGKQIALEQHKYIERAYDDLFSRERQVLEEYFEATGLDELLQATRWRSRSRRVPKEIQYIIDRFKLAAKYYLKDIRPPKPYVIEYIQRPSYEQEHWARMHQDSGVPCPPIRRKADVRELEHFAWFERQYVKGVDFTVNQVMKNGGGEWTEELAVCLIKWLEYAHPRDSSSVQDN